MKFFTFYFKYISAGLFLLNSLCLASFCHADSWRLGLSHQLVLDGKEFFPIGMYGVYSADGVEALKELKAAGFNAVQTYVYSKKYLQDYLREAQQVGLRAFIYPGTRLSRDEVDPLGKVASMVKTLSEKDAVLAWQLADEQEYNKILPEQVEELRRRIHLGDRSRPTALVIAKSNNYKNYAPVTDIMIVDPYPVSKEPLTGISDAVEKARIAVKNKKPVWVVVQLFGYQNEQHKGYGRKREPTIGEVRCMTYLAIVHGAKGIFYFAYHGSQYDVRLSPKYWEGVKGIAGELRDLTPVLLASGNGKKINVQDQGGGQKAIHSLVKKLDGKKYLFAVNTLNAPVHGIILGVEGSVQQIGVEFESRNVDRVDGVFVDNFAPYAVHIYKI